MENFENKLLKEIEAKMNKKTRIQTNFTYSERYGFNFKNTLDDNEQEVRQAYRNLRG